MKKKKEAFEETKLNEDFEVFEELENSGSPPSASGVLDKKPFDDAHGRQGGEVQDFKLEDPPPASYPESEPQTAAKSLADEVMELAPDVPVNLAVVIGKTNTNVGELMKYSVGKVIDLGKPPGETVDLVANGRLIARGELVEMDGKLGVRILKMVK